jgi:hypothetical protein
MSANGYDKRADSNRDVVLHVGREELVIRHRYEVVSIINDLLIGVWFAIGSILFFNPDTSRAGTWLFLIGSVQLIIRPAIRLTRFIHLRRISASRGRPSLMGPGADF